MKKLFFSFKNLHFFDYLLLGVVFTAGVSFLFFFFRQSQYLTVKIKVTDNNVLYAYSSPPAWYAYLFKKGMTEKNGLGQTTAEILDVYQYNVSAKNKATYLTVRLRTTFNSRSLEYKYKGEAVLVGESLRINFEKVLVEGLVVEVEGIKSPYEEKMVKITCRLFDNNSTFTETTGVDSFVAEAVEVGSKVKDAKGRVIAEILNKEVIAAAKNTFDYRGNVYQKLDPRKKDVTFEVQVLASQVNNELYFLDDVRISIGESIPLYFDETSLFPVITAIQEIKEADSF